MLHQSGNKTIFADVELTLAAKVNVVTKTMSTFTYGASLPRHSSPRTLDPIVARATKRRISRKRANVFLPGGRLGDTPRVTSLSRGKTLF